MLEKDEVEDVEERDERPERADYVAAAFSPAAPVKRRELFAGRIQQIAALINVCRTPGRHAIVYGERGVGKTSLASIGGLIAAEPGSGAVRVNCDGGDTYGSIWRKALDKIQLLDRTPGVGFDAADKESVYTAAAGLPKDPTPHDVESVLLALQPVLKTVLFFDEFDRVTDAGVPRLMADTIKTLSDQGVEATVVIVGVADDVGQLIAEHQSIERNVAQIPMPRMSVGELKEIVRTGLKSVDMEIEDGAIDRIARLSQGLPHYTHLLAQAAARSAVWASRDRIEISDVMIAMRKAVENSQHTLEVKHHQATSTSRARTLYPDVLLAAALAHQDGLGYFAAGDLRDPLQAITSKAYETSTFSQHLHALTEADRGCVLQKTGVPRRFRFRFSNPLFQPYLIMKALSQQAITYEVVDHFLPR